MTGALWILLGTIVAGFVLWAVNRYKGDSADAPPAEPQRPDGCCGQHAVCEKESLLAGVSDKIVYYADEDLDAYKGIAPDGYSDTQIDDFRDVLYTLLPEDLGGWARSIQLRGIRLPIPIQDELIMLAAEARKNKETN